MQRLKFEMCKNWREKGICKYGDKCLFAHGEKELTKKTNITSPVPLSSEKQAEEANKICTVSKFETPQKTSET
jgi:hypothetical protein